MKSGFTNTELKRIIRGRTFAWNWTAS
jgi:hypothetical protein